MCQQESKKTRECAAHSAIRRHYKNKLSPHNAETIGTVATGWVTKAASAVIKDTDAAYVRDGVEVTNTPTGAGVE